MDTNRMPDEVVDLLGAALVAELTVVASSGRLISYPLIPFYDGEHVLFTSAVLFSRKLAHIQANPKVSVALSDPVAMPGVPYHRAVIQGTALVLSDEDPHTSWERLMPLWRKKEPVIDMFAKRRFGIPLFFERHTIEVRPHRVVLWRDGDTSRPPDVTELSVPVGAL
ncbi:MAG: pyridoxamine 5'-phosphate oxidase family protein [Actinomycetota bacterium]|nr:pyridoxamine 5'-phosphate oxidase family protein [Actinomycetota bacterium]